MPLKMGLVTRRRRMSSDWTSGMPALSNVASSWLNTRNSRLGTVARTRQAEPRQRAASGLLNPEHEEALFLELAAEPRLAVGDVNPFDDVPTRSAEPAAILHGLPPALRRFRATSCYS